MPNSFGADILIQAPDPKKAAQFYVEHLGFEITDNNPKMIGLHGNNINLFIEPGPPLGPVLDVTVADVADAKQRLVVRWACSAVWECKSPAQPDGGEGLARTQRPPLRGGV